MTEPPDGLSIGELARRTDVPMPTLRSWESRYGFPRPHRAAGGHRRYSQSDIDLVEAVKRLRSSGISLQAAIGQATSAAAEAELSVFAGLRRRNPELIPQALRKITLLALTRAVEDECCARAEQPVLFASFQRECFFRRSESRWKELARTSRLAVVFADFSGPDQRPRAGTPIRVPLAADAPRAPRVDACMRLSGLSRLRERLGVSGSARDQRRWPAFRGDLERRSAGRQERR